MHVAFHSIICSYIYCCQELENKSKLDVDPRKDDDASPMSTYIAAC